MPKALNLIGKKFGKLTVLEKAPSRNGKTYWVCQCECGNIKEVQGAHLTFGSIKSCGNKECSIQEYEKICPICNTKFTTNAKNRIYCYNCSPIQENTGADYQRIKKRAIKHQLILYKGGKCECCGYNKCEGALQFHHKDPTQKEFGLGDINISKELDMDILYKEIDKCELLCANCHAEKHYQ